MKTEFKSLYELFEAIPDEKAAISYFKAIRWRNGEFCPYCGQDKKVLVFGMLERGGELRAKPMASQKDVRPEIFKQVSREAILMTDEWIAYTGLRQHYNHYTVNHCAGEYVSKDSGAHINTMEGAWSLLKRQIYGIHHWVSAKHVHRYVAEATWRFNRRVLKEDPRFAEF